MSGTAELRGNFVRRTGRARRQHSIRACAGLGERDLIGEISHAFGIAQTDVTVENDANAGALGEFHLGADAAAATCCTLPSAPASAAA